ncbi:doubled CXXCH motif family protein, partial [Vibrio parahaemolyticus V-223/04]
KPY